MRSRISFFKQKFSAVLNNLAFAWKSNSKFTIHPFKSLHSRHLLPLSISDYAARFSLELVILAIAGLGLIINFSVNNHAVSSNQSVIFAFLKNNPGLNRSLLNTSDTTTVIAQTDRLIPQALTNAGVVLTSSPTNSASSPDATTIQADVIVKTNPSDTQSTGRVGLTKYTVQPGDTVVSVATSWGLSPQTIMMENKLNNSSTLKPGQELTILPTTGITYTLKDGDTLDSLLKRYKVSEDDFLNANNIESFEDLAPGSQVVIPLQNITIPGQTKPAPSQFIKDESNQIALKQATAPADFKEGPVNFIWPTPVKTITQGFSSRHSGIDISDSKMEPVYAACTGVVEISGYQSNGYGNTIVINCGGGFKIRYGHLSEIYVSAGDPVTKGDLIGRQGRTGRVRGVTGIHLHFEIIKDGVHVNPLTYVRP